MKKIVSLGILMVGMILFYIYYSYTNQEFDYHVAQILWYFCQWSLILFILNLGGFVLSNEKYKKWVLITITYFMISIFLAYKTGDGNGTILSMNGEMMTWFLAGLYSLTSIIYFVVQFLKNLKQI